MLDLHKARMRMVEDQRITFLAFLRLCMLQTLTGSWELADYLSVFIGLVLGAIAYFIPAAEGKVTRLLLIVPLTSLATVTIVRLFLSPFFVYRNRDCSASATERQLQEAIRVNEENIRQKDEKISDLQKPKRSPAAQHDYDAAREKVLKLDARSVATLNRLLKKYC